MLFCNKICKEFNVIVISKFLKIFTTPDYLPVNYSNYDKLFKPIIVVIYLLIGLDAYLEFFIEENSIFFIKDIVKLIVISFLLSGYYLFNFNLKRILIITFYMVLISIYISMPFRIMEMSLPFEPYYLKVELLSLILTLGIGVLVRPFHMLMFVLLNVLFTIMSAILTKGSYPYAQFAFYLSVNSAAGFLGYMIYMMNLRLNSKISKHNSALAMRNIQLKELNESKIQLMRILGHDLRTPFAQIKGLADIAQDENAMSKSEYREHLIKASERGIQLLDEVLENARNSANEILLDIKPTYLQDLLNESLKFLEKEITDKDIYINIDIETNLYVNVDKLLFQTLIRNVISNAIKFSEDHSIIEVKGKKLNDDVVLTFRDYGVGMSGEKVREIMVSAEPINSTKVKSTTGLGIGLQICKSIIEKHAGKFSLKSDLGIGTTVELALPRIKA